MKEQRRLTRTVARTVAGAFLRDHYRKGGARTWDVDTVRAYLPKGWGANCLTERDCLPMTVDAIAQALLEFARPMQAWQMAQSLSAGTDLLQAASSLAQPGPAADRADHAAGTLPETTQRVILVEDDDAYRYVLARELRASGKFDVIDVPLAMQALNYLDRHPTISSAVVDIRMPVNTLTGLAFARMMRRRNRASHIVLMTGHPDYLSTEEVRPFGDVLFKASDTRALVAGIHQRLALHAGL